MMAVRRSFLASVKVLFVFLLVVSLSDSFTPMSPTRTAGVVKGPILFPKMKTTTTTALYSFFNKKQDDDEDLSFIETRDMTREEMAEYNRQFEDTVNQELVGMTVFSLIISLPLLYLAWVGLFSETAEIASDFSDLPYN